MLKSFFRPFLLTFFIGLFFLQLQFLYRHLGELVGKGVELVIIVEMMCYVSVALLPFNFPLAILLASVITFGTLGENYELVAMKSAGISLFYIIKPLLAVVAFLSIVAFFISNNVIPETNVRYKTILEGLKEQRPELILQDGVFTNEIDGYSMKVERIDKKTNELFDIIIYNHNQPENDGGVTVAPRGTISVTSDKRYVIINLYNGFNYQDGIGSLERNTGLKHLHRKTSFTKQMLRIRVFDFDFREADEAIFANHHRMLTTTQLNVVIDSLTADYRTLLNEHVNGYEFYKKAKTNNIVSSIALFHDSNNNHSFSSHPVTEKVLILNTAREGVRKCIQNILQDKHTFYEGQKKIRRYQIEKHRKITLSLAILIFFLIGSSFGAVVRKGGLSIPVLFCFLLLVIYFVISLFGERMILTGSITVFAGAWLPYCALLPLAVWLTYLSVSDSTIMEADSYQKQMKRIIAFVFSEKK